jgi:S1-C subfamily serine protease
VGDLKAGLLDKKPGDTIVLTIRRQQETMTVPVELSNMDMSAMMMPPGHPK